MTGNRVSTTVNIEGVPTELYPALMLHARARALTESWRLRAELAARELTPPRPGWATAGACFGLPTSLMFPGPSRGSADDALRMCRTWCPVTLQCLRAAAIAERREHHSHIFGVRGALTAQHRGIAYRAARAKATA